MATIVSFWALFIICALYFKLTDQCPSCGNMWNVQRRNEESFWCGLCESDFKAAKQKLFDNTAESISRARDIWACFTIGLILNFAIVGWHYHPILAIVGSVIAATIVAVAEEVTGYILDRMHPERKLWWIRVGDSADEFGDRESL